MYTDYLETPMGLMECQASDIGIRQLIFCGSDRGVEKPNTVTDACKVQLFEYFEGARREFDLPIDTQGTDFQKVVWRCLSQIPFGQTLTYADIAKRVNKPKGAQAVGGANGRNPISIIVPCHRVIGANGSLTGYAGGLERKLWLLRHEGIAIKHSVCELYGDVRSVIQHRQAKTQFLN
ncbi:methylated-DNA--[protein]-cysteine S-methyltransferase [uncultured Shewanella sp.]|uniref:methylated-DNA--[protein]-cysteine S-methyltransferase n=1 Tax=uncultured Shewanella sp. TaxID=173975 RepID=UPI002628F01B|nr:methylated-DNA--[protein]-cysteine S-methyltransferase [uncultured Shewanella sp.]